MYFDIYVNSSILFLILLFAYVFVLIVKSRMVKGTHPRFLAKTGEIVILTFTILTMLVSTVACALSDEIMLAKVLYVTFGVGMSYLYASWLQQLLKDDDDDWFGNTTKKVKGWLKNVRKARRLKPVTTAKRLKVG